MGSTLTLGLSLLAGVILSALLPMIAFALLQVMSGLSRLDAAAVAAHYGSISIVTFVAATSVLQSSGIVSEGYMVAVAAAMEAPAILSALWLISRGGAGDQQKMDAELVARDPAERVDRAAGRGLRHRLDHRRRGAGRDRQLSSSRRSRACLCLFLLDMGLVAGRGLRGGGAVLGPACWPSAS